MFMNAKYFLHHDHDGQRAIGRFWPRVVRWHVLSREGMEVSPAVMASSGVETMVEACGAAAGAKPVFSHGILRTNEWISAKINIDTGLTTHSAL